MNSIKKYPAHFSLNLGKLHLHNNGENPYIVFCRLTASAPALKYDTARFQEFVIDACESKTPAALSALLSDLKTNLLQFTVRTLLINTTEQAQAVMPFLPHIRLIESTNLNVLSAFPIYKTRLACSSFEELRQAKEYRYYIYRNPKQEQMNLPFEKIKTVQIPEYNISYYLNGDFIYSVYKQIK